MLMFLAFLLINLLILFVNGDDTCAPYKSVPDLDLNQLSGQWWEYQSKNIIGEHDCLTVNFYNPKENELTMVMDYILRAPNRINEDHTTREWQFETGVDSFADNLYSKKKVDGKPLYEVRVIDINPGNWVVMFVCSKHYNFLAEVLILTKKQTLEKAELFKFEKHLRTIVGQWPHLTLKSRLRPPAFNWYERKVNTKCSPVDFPDEWYESVE